jgi:DNA-directed RNA polymerase specialized sigma subunit
MGYSQMHISRLLAKALATLRSEVREPALAVTA